jgi:cytoskeletal protein RodZ
MIPFVSKLLPDLSSVFKWIAIILVAIIALVSCGALIKTFNASKQDAVENASNKKIIEAVVQTNTENKKALETKKEADEITNTSVVSIDTKKGDIAQSTKTIVNKSNKAKDAVQQASPAVNGKHKVEEVKAIAAIAIDAMWEAHCAAGCTSDL